ncbi:ATP-dependent helicase [Spiroplasma endosymbiont of Nephrotoma flavescens]|uniref:ATP-dependent helicase n=1 Tax=Spiroplasma endosymbiont of Nephrotoma flavescens TaxID=3066302 RepID=UPI00313EEA83
MNINHLNEEQKLAVLSSEGANRIIAGAGSGKTRVIFYKIAHLIHNLAISSNQILAVTFTNKAANEMKSRLNELVGDQSKYTWVHTYHAFCVRVLRNDIVVLGYTKDFIIIDTVDKINILKDIIKNKQYNFDSNEIKKVSSMISYWKNHQLSYSDIINSDFYHEHKQQWLEIYKIYLQNLPKNNMVDFDDLLTLTLELFSHHAEVLQKWQKRFSYVLVDEFQDTNELQFELINYLVKIHQNITVVGDPDQTIYSFRGAKARLILDFDNYFPNGKTFILNQNYRSTQNILNVANILISYNHSRIAKDLFTMNDYGSKTKLYHGNTSIRETNWVAKEIKKLVEKKILLNNILILYRANYLSRDLEEALINNHINYRIYGGFKFFERKEIKDVLAYLKTLVYGDQLSTVRVLNLIKGVGMTTINNLIEQSQNNHQSLLKYLMVNVASLKPLIIELVTYLKVWKEKLKSYEKMTLFSQDFLNNGNYLQQLADGFEEERLENVKELFNHMENYDLQNVDSLQGMELLQHYLQEVSLYVDQDENSANQDRVSLMTSHNAKGLEYDFVFIIGLNEGIFPNTLSIEEGISAIEEERRVLYVAITRARKGLFLSYSEGFSYVTNNYRLPSRFVIEINPSLLELKSDEQLEDTKRSLSWTIPKNISLTPAKKSQWKTGDVIQHSTFGKGIVTNILNSNVEVAFNSGIKVLRSNHPLLKKVLSED